MENCKISGKNQGKSQGILKLIISGNPVHGFHALLHVPIPVHCHGVTVGKKVLLSCQFHLK